MYCGLLGQITQRNANQIRQEENGEQARVTAGRRSCRRREEILKMKSDSLTQKP